MSQQTHRNHECKTVSDMPYGAEDIHICTQRRRSEQVSSSIRCFAVLAILFCSHRIDITVSWRKCPYLSRRCDCSSGYRIDYSVCSSTIQKCKSISASNRQSTLPRRLLEPVQTMLAWIDFELDLHTSQAREVHRDIVHILGTVWLWHRARLGRYPATWRPRKPSTLDNTQQKSKPMSGFNVYNFAAWRT